MTNTFVNSISRDIYRSARTGYRRAVADHHRVAEQRFDLLDVQGFRFCNAAAAAYLSIVRVFCEREGTFFFFLEKRALQLKSKLNGRRHFFFLLDLRVQSIDFFLILALSRASRAWFVLHQHL